MTKTNHPPDGPDFRHQGRRFGERAAELAGFATSLLGWRPDEFWSATPAEFATALGLDSQSDEQMDRAAMERLLTLFPDNRES
jgi:uncharacterized phage protein (TIGR02216 family)